MIVIESINHIGITVSNLEESVKFYKDLFDFEPIDRGSAPGFALMRVADINIGLYESPGYRGPDGPQGRIAFYVDEEDFEDAVDEIQERELTIIHGPENLRKGKVVVFLDPDGNQIELSYPAA